MIIGKYQWKIKNDEKIIDNNKRVDHIINTILEDRGIITEKDKRLFLEPEFEKMHNPMDLPDMKKAVKRIERARLKEEKVTIYGDYDVDGITSTSILYMFFKENGYHIDYYIPNRVSEGYGFNKEALEEIRNAGTTLLISVDTGISANKEVAFANEIGLDIIITDHHECLENLPEAHAIINPKRPDSNYPFQELAGVGVAFKLIHAMAITFNNIGTIWKYIDIVAVGTVADIVPLRGENRIIVRNAFKTIPTTWNIGLAALMEVSGCKDKKITAGTIGFQIGPRLNAAGRLGDAKKGVELFTTLDPAVAAQIANDLDTENKNRKAIEQEIFNLAIKKIEQDPQINEKNVIVVASEGWHNGVIGIVSSRITERYYKPSIVISIEDGKGTGSARSIEGFSMFDALCNSSHFLEKFGGHDMAAGLSLEADQIKGFREHINEYGQMILDKEILSPKIEIDYVLNERDINLPMVEALENLEPYGVGNPTPVFSYHAQVYSVRGIGADGSHLKMQLYTPDRLIDSIGFGMGAHNEMIAKGEEIMIAGQLQKNEWLGKITPQIVIKDIKSPQDEQIKSDYYLSLYKSLPNPSARELKVFTKHIENCYISSYGDPDGIKVAKDYENQLKYMIPTRDDAIAIYRFIKELSMAKMNEHPMHALIRDVKKDCMSEYKVLQILDIFQELGLLTYQYHEKNGLIMFNIVEGIKTDLSKSKKYIALCGLNDAFNIIKGAKQ